MATSEKVLAARAAKMSEKGLDLKVRALLNELRLAPFSFHPTDGVGGMRPGWPDWTIIGSRVIFRELKAEKGYLSPVQKLVVAHLQAVGADVAVWKPRDLYSGRIAAELAEIADVGTRQRAGVVIDLLAVQRAKAKAKAEAKGVPAGRPGGNVRRRAA
jgi:hypothetical protein